jgi:serine/threonine protein kinase
MSAKQIAGYTVYTSQILGRGSFGNVCRGIKDDTGERLAVKIIPKYRSNSDHMQSKKTNT